MPVLKLVTLNILNDLSRWPQRRSILAAQMADLQPDVITLQEVALPENSAQWLADQLGGYCVASVRALTTKAGKKALRS